MTLDRPLIRSYISASWPVLLPVVAGLIGLSVSLFPSAGRDDAYITYWAAHTLREFGEIANISGAHIEQSTSLLHVLVLGVLSFVTRLSVPAIGPPMSVVFGVVTVIYTYEFARLYVGRSYAVGAAMIVATAAPFVYWTTGGLEGTMTALAATVLLYHLTRYHRTGPEPGGLRRRFGSAWWHSSSRGRRRSSSSHRLLLGMFVILRIRGIMVADERLEDYALAIRRVHVGGARGGSAHGRNHHVQVVVFRRLAAPAGGGKAGRQWHFSPRWATGFEYLTSALMPPPVSLLPFFAIAGTVYLARRLVRDEPEFIGGLLLALYAVAYISFIFLVGGDWMEGSRFIVPVIPALAVLAVVIIPRIKLRDLQVYAIGGIIAFHVMGAVWFAKFGSVSTPIWEVSQVEQTDLPIERYSWFARPNRTHLRDMPVVEELGSVIERLQSEVDGKPVVMSGQAGFVPYHAIGPHYGKVEFIDRRGVTTPHFTDCEDHRRRRTRQHGASPCAAEVFRIRGGH